MYGYRCAAGRNVAEDAVSLAEQVGGLLTGNKVSRNSLGNVLTGAASAARQTVAEQIDNDALRFLYNAGMFAGDMVLGAGVDKLGGRLLGRLGLSGLGSVDDSYRASRGLTGYGGDIEELAGRYSGSTRRAFLSGYDGGVDPQTYARGFDFYHGEGNIFDRRQWRMKGENGGRRGRRLARRFTRRRQSRAPQEDGHGL